MTHLASELQEWEGPSVQSLLQECGMNIMQEEPQTDDLEPITEGLGSCRVFLMNNEMTPIEIKCRSLDTKRRSNYNSYNRSKPIVIQWQLTERM